MSRVDSWVGLGEMVSVYANVLAFLLRSLFDWNTVVIIPHLRELKLSAYLKFMQVAGAG